MSKNLLVVSVLGLIMIGLIGWGIYSYNNTQKTNHGLEIGVGGGPNTTSMGASPSSRLRETLQTLLQQHGTLASSHLQNIYDGNDLSNSSLELDENSIKIADTIALIGGVEARNDFLPLWRAHIKSYEEYTKALKNNDRNSTAQIRGELNAEAVAMGALVNQLIPTLTTENVAAMMNEHIDLTLSIIEAHARNNSPEQMTQMTKASIQALQMANSLADGIESSR